MPSHVNAWLLTDILRREWGFNGLVVSDYFGIEQLATRHHVAMDKADAGAQALEAGVDLELPDPHGFPELVALVKAGRIPESLIDRSVARMLRAKFLAGLFERPYVDPDRAERVTNTPAHQALALEAARKSIVLLKNEGGLLPLDRGKVKTLAVIGPNAKGLHLGGYSRDPGRGVDVLTGIADRAGSGIKVLYAEGVRITEHEANWSGDAVVLGDAGEEPCAHSGSGQGGAPGRCDRPRDRHERIGLTRSVGRQSPRRRRRSQVDEQSGGARRRDAPNRQAGDRAPHQRPPARAADGRRTRSRGCRSVVRRVRKGARRSARSCSATSTPAGNCRSHSLVIPVSFPSTTIGGQRRSVPTSI